MLIEPRLFHLFVQIQYQSGEYYWVHVIYAYDYDYAYVPVFMCEREGFRVSAGWLAAPNARQFVTAEMAKKIKDIVQPFEGWGDLLD